MGRKGFTLIELLAVLVLMAVIALIATVSVKSTLSNSKSSLSETQKNNIENAAKTYYLKEGILEEDPDSDVVNACVNLSYLIEKGYIESKEVKDPKTKKAMSGSVKITYEANQYEYEYQSDVCE